jgi:exonuclease III
VRSATHEQGARSINTVNSPLDAGSPPARPAAQREQEPGNNLPRLNQSMSVNDDHNRPATAQDVADGDGLTPPPRDEGEAEVDDWGDGMSDMEIDEETLRAEWLADNETHHGKRTKASVLIASCNMKGRGETDHLDRLSSNNKWMHINQIMRERKLGILALQETHMTDDLDAKINGLFGKRILTIHSRDEESPNSKGVSLVINKELLNTDNIKSADIIAGRAIAANIPWHGNENLTILAIYAPNRPDENRNFWNELNEKWERMRLPKPDIVVGDFNFVESFVDRLPAHEDRPDVVRSFDRFKSKMKLADGWRLLNPGAREYTYMQAQSEGQPQSRLDRIYASNKIISNSQEWGISPTGGIQTDHWMVTIRVLSDNTPFQGPGRWSLPLFLLRDKILMDQIRELAKTLENDIERCEYRRTTERNPQTLFKTFKQEVATAGRERAKEAVPALKHKIDNLTDQRRKTANNPRIPPRERKEATIQITE